MKKYKITLTNGTIIAKAQDWLAAVGRAEEIARMTDGELRVVAVQDDEDDD